MDLNDIRAAERDGKLSSLSKDTLEAMRDVCTRHIQSADWSAVHSKQSVDEEIRRKEAEEVDARASLRHEAVLLEYQRLKASIDRLAKPHWVLWATLLAGAIAALAALLLLVR